MIDFPDVVVGAALLRVQSLNCLTEVRFELVVPATAHVLAFSLQVGVKCPAQLGGPCKRNVKCVADVRNANLVIGVGSDAEIYADGVVKTVVDVSYDLGIEI